MPQLRMLQWWPTAWQSDSGTAPTAGEIRQTGVLRNVGRSHNTLTFVVDCNGVICTATIDPQLPEHTVILLRHILLQHYGESVAAVEDLNVELDDVIPHVR